jgi:hypothetical protein
MKRNADKDFDVTCIAPLVFGVIAGFSLMMGTPVVMRAFGALVGQPDITTAQMFVPYFIQAMIAAYLVGKLNNGFWEESLKKSWAAIGYGLTVPAFLMVSTMAHYQEDMFTLILVSYAVLAGAMMFCGLLREPRTV